jgi:hypothetical protein
MEQVAVRGFASAGAATKISGTAAARRRLFMSSA